MLWFSFIRSWRESYSANLYLLAFTIMQIIYKDMNLQIQMPNAMCHWMTHHAWRLHGISSQILNYQPFITGKSVTGKVRMILWENLPPNILERKPSPRHCFVSNIGMHQNTRTGWTFNSLRCPPSKRVLPSLPWSLCFPWLCWFCIQSWWLLL